MASMANNPISRLLDIEFPDIKRANWNCSHSIALTASPCFVNPVFVDRILPNTRVKFDMKTASFANATVAPLYGRFKVKYLAFWAPDRLYVRRWLMGDKFTVGDDVPYPTIPLERAYPSGIYINIDDDGLSKLNQMAMGHGTPYVPPTSLIEMLGVYPAYTQSMDWTEVDDRDPYFNIGQFNPPTPSNGFPFLAFWDIYRHFIMNQQEESFPVRVKSFKVPIYDGDDVVVPGQLPEDYQMLREDIDDFLEQVKVSWTDNLVSAWNGIFPIGIFPKKDVQPLDSVTQDEFNILYNPEKVSNYVQRDEFNYLKPIAPYSSDPYTSWISNENVELERSRSFVDTSNGGFSMEQWKVASKIQNMYRKSLFKNDDFAEYMDVQYGVRPSMGITKPMFLAAFESDIVFSDVVSTAQTGSGDNPENNDALGSRAGYGHGRNTDKNNFVDFTSKEPGTFMILQIIMPEVFYFEGRDLMYDKQNFSEEFNPEFDAIGYQDLQKSQMNLCPGLSLDPFGRNAYRGKYEAFNTAIAKQPYAMEHMVKPNLLKGMMVMPNYYQKYTLARSFNYNRGNLTSIQSPARGMYSTYPFPEMYNNIFQSQINADNFQFYLQFDYLKYQVIGKQFLSF